MNNYEIIRYPDGQISVKVKAKDLKDMYPIAMRINSYEDLFVVKSLCEAMGNSLLRPSLFIPCMFGQRSDRRFDVTQSFDLKIICDFINSCNFQKVTIFDPHSYVTLALLNNSEESKSKEYVALALLQEPEGTVLISPDAGAYKKVFEYAEGFKTEVVSAVKHRDLNGNISLAVTGDLKGKNCLIVDDLADGGYTFVKLGEQLKTLGAARVTLYVSHGYFSKGFDELKKHIDHIYCTNSVKDIIDPFVTQFKII